MFFLRVSFILVLSSTGFAQELGAQQNSAPRFLPRFLAGAYQSAANYYQSWRGQGAANLQSQTVNSPAQQISYPAAPAQPATYYPTIPSNYFPTIPGQPANYYPTVPAQQTTNANPKAGGWRLPPDVLTWQQFLAWGKANPNAQSSPRYVDSGGQSVCTFGGDSISCAPIEQVLTRGNPLRGGIGPMPGPVTLAPVVDAPGAPGSLAPTRPVWPVLINAPNKPPAWQVYVDPPNKPLTGPSICTPIKNAWGEVVSVACNGSSIPALPGSTTTQQCSPQTPQMNAQRNNTMMMNQWTSFAQNEIKQSASCLRTPQGQILGNSAVGFASTTNCASAQTVNQVYTSSANYQAKVLDAISSTGCRDAYTKTVADFNKWMASTGNHYMDAAPALTTQPMPASVGTSSSVPMQSVGAVYRGGGSAVAGRTAD